MHDASKPLSDMSPDTSPVETPNISHGTSHDTLLKTVPNTSCVAVPDTSLDTLSASLPTPLSQTLLDSLVSPVDVRALDNSQLEQLAQEVRQRIIEVVSKNGGHLAPSLGVVELTLALLHCFDADRDKFVWDVGHQAYAWKLLTGRANQFATLRKLHGISGFPRPSESPYDHFGVGHSSTSISAALGMAMARDLTRGENAANEHVIAVIGDGSMTAGQALEGLNLAGHMEKRCIVILNDNEMSISPNVGALSRFLSRTLSSRWVRQTKKDVLKLLRSIPRVGPDLATYAMRGEWSFKSFFTPGMLFEAFRFTYIGPVDGHDLVALKKHIEKAAAVEDGPVLLHVLTTKGKGYAPAEKDPCHFHGVGAFDPTQRQEAESLAEKIPSAPAPQTCAPITFTNAFAACLTALGERDERIFTITAAMPEGTGTHAFQERFPERFMDVGICEQHAVTFAAGLAMQGLRPVVAIYSTFLQRAYDQVLHDVCLQKAPVTFCLDRAGLVGEDGATHHGVFDIAYLRHIPHIRILAPRDEALLCHALFTAISGNAPTAIRYPRGKGFGEEHGVIMPQLSAGNAELRSLEEGQGEILCEGADMLIMAVGSCAHFALSAAKTLQAEHNVSVTVFDPIWLKPLPDAQILDLVRNHAKLLLVEEGMLAGGFSSSILELLADNALLGGIRLKRLGIGDAFVEHGTQQELRTLVGLTAENIVHEALQLVVAQ